MALTVMACSNVLSLHRARRVILLALFPASAIAHFTIHQASLTSANDPLWHMLLDRAHSSMLLIPSRALNPTQLHWLRAPAWVTEWRYAPQLDCSGFRYHLSTYLWFTIFKSYLRTTGEFHRKQPLPTYLPRGRSRLEKRILGRGPIKNCKTGHQGTAWRELE